MAFAPSRFRNGLRRFAVKAMAGLLFLANTSFNEKSASSPGQNDDAVAAKADQVIRQQLRAAAYREVREKLLKKAPPETAPVMSPEITADIAIASPVIGGFGKAKKLISSTFQSHRRLKGLGKAYAKGKPHRGTDMALAAGTPVLTAWAGAVLTESIPAGHGRLGTVRMRKYDSATGITYQADYLHVRPYKKRAKGYVYQPGDTVATVAHGGPCSKGDHLHFGMKYSTDGKHFQYLNTTTILRHDGVCNLTRDRKSGKARRAKTQPGLTPFMLAQLAKDSTGQQVLTELPARTEKLYDAHKISKNIYRSRKRNCKIVAQQVDAVYQQKLAFAAALLPDLKKTDGNVQAPATLQPNPVPVLLPTAAQPIVVSPIVPVMVEAGLQVTQHSAQQQKNKNMVRRFSRLTP